MIRIEFALPDIAQSIKVHAFQASTVSKQAVNRINIAKAAQISLYRGIASRNDDIRRDGRSLCRSNHYIAKGDC